jgi:hypothetical protein
MPKRNYQSSWQEKPGVAAVKRSALKLAQAIAELGDDVDPKHQRKLLRDIVWIVTEANSKYNTRYVLEHVYKAQKPNHEHVVPIESLVKRMLERPDIISQVLDDAIGCLVTKEEHRLLPKKSTGEGWDRYRQGWHPSLRPAERKVARFLKLNPRACLCKNSMHSKAYVYRCSPF